MSAHKYVIYAGDDLGIQGSVMNTHAINLSRVFTELGYEVLFVSQEGRKPDMAYEINETGFHCFYPHEPNISSTTLRILLKKINSVTGHDQWKLVKILCEEYTPALIVYYGYACVRQLTSYSEKKKIPFLVERTDWLERDHYYSFFDRYIYSRFTNRCIKKWSTRATGIIAISDFFYDYYSKKMPVIKIPPLFGDDIIADISEAREGTLRLVYAGSPGNKDVLLPALIAVTEINKAGGARVKLDIVGIDDFPNEEDPDYEYLGITFHGRLEHEEALRVISEADCSLLLRHDRLYAKAGFSTKLSESMWMGVPVICTAIGGTDTCITDEENGFLVSDNSTDTIRSKIEEILQLQNLKLSGIKKEAYSFAHRYFSYKEYVSKMRSFIEMIDRN